MTKNAQRMLALMDRTTRLWHIPNVGRAKGRVIRRLIERHRSTRGVEIGSLLGYSAILIAGSMLPRGRLTCLEHSDYLARMTKANAEEAGLGRKVKVIQGDALRLLPLLAGRFDFVFIDATKEDYLDYLRSLEPKLVAGAVVVADNTGVYRKEVAPYLDYVRGSADYTSREHEFDDDAMEVSLFRSRPS
ncbi:MAG TPA: class I SAM-dependent methyltransferase [Methylomirabilota bacterium]|jgi:predicted O-methyltransferase YrrM|nr:class I SAM-dependent methyltransferase [Methylomirabilota bacterium]